MSKMERDKAEQYVWKITEYYDHMNDLDSAIDLLNEYADQRVIEELEEVLTKEIESFGVNVISSQAVINKIKQLKQD